MQAEQTSNAVIKMVISMVIFGSIGFFSEHTNVPSIELVFVDVCAPHCFWAFAGLVPDGTAPNNGTGVRCCRHWPADFFSC